MRKHRKNTLLMFLVLLTLMACEKLDLPKETPKCITKKIKKEKDNRCLEKVYAYDYRERTVYFFMYPCPEGCYALVENNCDAVQDSSGDPMCSCSFAGAFCNDDFWNKRTNERLIWQK